MVFQICSKMILSLAALATVAWMPSGVSAQTVLDVAIENDFTTLVAAVQAAGLVDALSTEDADFTVFAPTNEAFESVNVTMLLEDQWRAHLTSVLLYHVLPIEVESGDLEVGLSAETLEGAFVNITSLNPPQVNNAEIIIADVEAENGIVHVIDDVLLPPSMTSSIVDLAVATPELSTLVELVTLAELADVLATDGPFTVFAPTNDAFAALDDATVTALTDDPSGALTNVLLYHVVPGIILAEDLVDGATVTTLQGSDITVSLDPAMINDANVVLPDVLANNGVVHVIDAVIVPPPVPAPVPAPAPADEPTETIVDLAVATPDLSTLVELVTLAGLADVLATGGPFTVFAPTNDAFAALDDATVTALTGDPSGALADVLLYHVVEGTVLAEELTDGQLVTTLNGAEVVVSIGDSVMINDATVVLPDVLASNGVVHVIDAVIVPPPVPAPVPAPAPADEPTETIVDLAVATPDLSTLVELVTLAGLAEVLATGGPFTVFAPTNDAFAALDHATVTALAADPSGALTDVLLYHVVEGTVLAEDLTDGQRVTTLNGAVLEVSIGDSVMINDATVVLPDVLANNGVVHVVDAVLVPPADTASAAGYDRLESTDFSRACIEVKDGIATNGQRVMLGDCTSANGGWRLDDSGRFRSELDDDFCLQAGYGYARSMVGLVVRIQHCDDHNRLQEWKYSDGEYLSPSLHDDLCAVWRGTTPNVGEDPIILIDCAHAAHRKGWTLA
ncbi:beta-induced protein ig-h3 [Seminavis robusta]|uniref:Beta-induced protein ig-h3 n=1 Tax=Seminavis robusta TaxID=568900 RepID=A0A9N8ENL3_9STRA|nr:beta-induced protein ig-h3 [Seminavis robusta]|eukprot:Sro1478_g276030.1 beta-induced protein ig-h3 (736) ;mRNA; f:10915-13667